MEGREEPDDAEENDDDDDDDEDDDEEVWGLSDHAIFILVAMVHTPGIWYLVEVFAVRTYDPVICFFLKWLSSTHY